MPDLPSCVAVGETMEEVRTLITETIEFHIEGLRQDGSPVPQPSSAVSLSKFLLLSQPLPLPARSH
ncbi:MAG: type II toxin-antitoxin system HicB family antitoxin [Candidatus Poribacteria bacterium]|nr:type II toxin-antitoxin system HicB family antitoxin [Candidatus Poribacteria bacterium]